jgi:putative aminopeptidase FrvX
LVKPLHMEIVESLLSAPTAPFAEGAVVERVRGWAVRLGLAQRVDSAGNVWLRPRGARRTASPWIFEAHMDHPGFLARSRKGRRVEADFIGGVRLEFFRGARAVFFAPAGQVRATVIRARPAPHKMHVVCAMKIDGPAREVPPGTLGMWDLPAMRVAGGRLISRACDDVVGAAAVICALAEIVSRDPRADVRGMFTVAEEAGFVGAVAACETGGVPKGARIVGVETSAAQKPVRLGDGVVIRVGDRAWTFDASLTCDIAAIADDLARGDLAFRYARQLMSGGVCESTAYCLWGHRAAALCVPLANYHNMSPRGRIAAEAIDLNDFESLVKLLSALPASRRTQGEAGRAFRKRCTDRMKFWQNKVRG